MCIQISLNLSNFSHSLSLDLDSPIKFSLDLGKQDVLGLKKFCMWIQEILLVFKLIFFVLYHVHFIIL